MALPIGPADSLAQMKIVGADRLRKKMDRAKKKLIHRKKLNARAVVTVDKWIQRNFQQEGKLTGQKWKALSASTLLARRNKKAGSIKILQDTGEMRKSWKHQWNDKVARIMNMKPYSIKHQKGIDVPIRRIIPSESEIMPDLRKIFQNYVKTSLKG